MYAGVNYATAMRVGYGMRMQVCTVRFISNRTVLYLVILTDHIVIHCIIKEYLVSLLSLVAKFALDSTYQTHKYEKTANE